MSFQLTNFAFVSRWERPLEVRHEQLQYESIGVITEAGGERTKKSILYKILRQDAFFR